MHPADVQYMQDPANRAEFIAAGNLKDEWRQQLVGTFPTSEAVQRAHNIIVRGVLQERPQTDLIDLHDLIAEKVSLKLENALQLGVDIGLEGKTLTYQPVSGAGAAPLGNAARIADLVRQDIPHDKDIIAAYLRTSVPEVIAEYEHRLDYEANRSEYERYEPADVGEAQDTDYAEYLEQGEALFNPAPPREADQLPESLRLARLNFPNAPTTHHPPRSEQGNGHPTAGSFDLRPNDPGIGR